MAAYGETVRVSGTATAANQSVDDLPLTLRAGERTLGTTTVENGSFTETVAVPGTVPVGERSLSVSFDPDDRALMAASADRPITIEATPTELEVDAEWTDESTVRIDGTFTTADGSGIEGEAIDLEVDSVTDGTVTTDEDGTIETTVSPSDPAEPVTVVATYEGDGSNLERAQDDATVSGFGSNRGGADRVSCRSPLPSPSVALSSVCWSVSCGGSIGTTRTKPTGNTGRTSGRRSRQSRSRRRVPSGPPIRHSRVRNATSPTAGPTLPFGAVMQRSETLSNRSSRPTRFRC
ncbi:hypothetical protein D8S78_20875 [Natrialba swarupiae]|nr:hypothetical protein [Natrialba swarupiae]